MTQRTLAIILIIAASVMGYHTATTSSRVANILFTNGTIYTLDPTNAVAEAVAIRGSRIVGVGSTAELQERFNAQTVIDLQGKTVMPGLVDGHAHILGEGSRLSNLDLVGTVSAEAVTELVRARAGELQPGEWIFGRGWDQNDWNVKEFPRHELLDKAAPANPVVLTRVDGHAIWVNASVLALARIAKGVKDPEGGRILKDADGNPTGILIDNAIALVDSVVPLLTDAQVEDRLKRSLQECASLGLTEVHDMGVDLQTIRTYKKLIDKGECPIRIYAAIDGSGETWETYKTTGPTVRYGDGFLTVRAIKIYVDGALGSRGAALVEAYSDDAENRGLTRTSAEEMKTICRDAAEKGFQVCTHAIGDRGNNITLDIYEHVLSTTLSPDSPPPRWRIEHAQVLLPSDIARFTKLGVIPSMQPTHATSDMYWAEARLGSERVKTAYAWRSLIASGATVIAGSDFPVEGVSPLWGFYAAITRADRSGYPEAGWHAEQRMTRDEAARAFTSWAAKGAFEESEKGSIEPGKWADLTILSRDIMKITAKEILTTEVEYTIVGGKIVYSRSERVPAP